MLIATDRSPDIRYRYLIRTSTKILSVNGKYVFVDRNEIHLENWFRLLSLGFRYSKSNKNERNETKLEIEVQIEFKTIQQLHIQH